MGYGFNFGGFLSGLSSLLPGYIEGQRQANKDNWDDLGNFNKVQAGQIDNAFREATFDSDVGMHKLGFQNGRLGLWDHALQSAVNTAWLPSHIADANAHAQYAPELGWANVWSKLSMPFMTQQQFNYMMGSGMMGMPGTLSGASALGMPPSVLRR